MICFRVAVRNLTDPSPHLRIARNVKFFETWCSYNGCEQVAFSDLPNNFKDDASIVFNFKGKLPEKLIDKAS